MSQIADLVASMVQDDLASGQAEQPSFVDSILSDMLAEQVDINQQNSFLAQSGVLNNPIVNPRTGQMFNPPNLEGIKQSIFSQVGELAKESAKEAIKAEFLLLPGLVVSGAEYLKKNPVFRFTAPPGMLSAIDSANEAFGEDIGPRLMANYRRTYDRMIDLEAELAISMEKLADSEAAGTAAIGAAAGVNTVGNLVVGAANPLGMLAHGIAGGIRLSTRGLMALGTAWFGRKGVAKLLAKEGADTANSKLAKAIDTAANIGRIPATEQVEQAIAQAAGIKKSLIDSAGELGSRTRHDLTLDLINEFKAGKDRQAAMFIAQEKRRAAGLPQPAGVPTVPPGDFLQTGALPSVRGLDVKGVRAMEEAARRDFLVRRQVGRTQADQIPIQSTNVYSEARKQIERLRNVEPGRAALDNVTVNPKIKVSLASADDPLMEFPKSGPIAYREVQLPDGTVERIPVAKLFQNKKGELKVRQPRKKDVQNSFALAEDAKIVLKGMTKNADDARNLASQLDQSGGSLARDAAEELRKGAAETDRVVAATRRDPGAPHSLLRPSFEGIEKIVDPTRHGEQVAGRFIHHRQMALMDAATKTQHLMEEVPDKATRQDLWALLEEDGNPFRSLDDTIDDVRSRLEVHPESAKLFALAEKIRQRLDIFYKEANELRVALGDSELSYVENYVQHLWQEPIDEVRNKFAKLPRFQLTPEGKFEKSRTIATYMQGMREAGLTPRTTDPAEMFYLAEQEYARVMATKKMVLDMTETAVDENGQLLIQRIAADQSIPDGYVEFRSAFTNRLLPDVDAGKTKVIMQKDMFKQLKNVIKTPLEPATLHKISALAKRSNFFYTFFHMYSLVESGMALLPSFTGKNAGQALVNGVKGQLVGPEIATRAMFTPKSKWNAGEALAHLVSTPTMREATELASFYGVRFGPPPIDVAKTQADRMIRDFVTRVEAKHPKTGKALSAAERLMVGKIQGFFDERMWERFHTPMKAIAFDMVFHQMKGIRDGITKGVIPLGLSKRMLKDMSDDELGRSIGKFINDEFGGQNWEQHVDGFMGWLSDPDVLRNINSVFLSVDWNVSSLRASTAFLQSIPNTPVSDPVRGILGTRHWRNAGLGWLMYANTINKVLSGHGIKDNEPGKRVFYIDTGERNEDGRPIYLHIGKQFREMGTLAAIGKGEAQPIFEFLGRKSMPWFRMAIAGGSKFSQLQAIEREFIKEGRELGWLDKLVLTGQEAAGTVAPISVQNQGSTALRDASLGVRAASSIGFPASLGPSDTKMVTSLAEAMRRGDTDEVQKLQVSLAESRGPQEAARLVNMARRKVEGNTQPTRPLESTLRRIFK